MGALETPDAIHAAGTFAGAAAVGGFPANRMITSAGYLSCTRVSAGVYDLEFEQPINLGEASIQIGLPVYLPGYSAGASIASDSESMRVTTYDAAGNAADVDIFMLSVVKVPGGASYSIAFPANAPKAPALVPGYVYGFSLAPATATTLAVGPGSANDDTDSEVLTTAVTTAIDLDVVGLNGLDAGARAAATSYHVFVIGGAAVPTGFLVSTSDTAPVLPAGYTTQRRISSFHTLAAAATILMFKQAGLGTDRSYRFTLSDAARLLTTPAVANVDTEVSVAGCVPVTADTAQVEVSLACTTAGSFAIGLGGDFAAALLSATAAEIAGGNTTPNKTGEFDVPLDIVPGLATIGFNYLTSVNTLTPTTLVNGYSDSI